MKKNERTISEKSDQTDIINMIINIAKFVYTTIIYL